MFLPLHLRTSEITYPIWGTPPDRRLTPLGCQTPSLRRSRPCSDRGCAESLRCRAELEVDPRAVVLAGLLVKPPCFVDRGEQTIFPIGKSGHVDVLAG